MNKYKPPPSEWRPLFARAATAFAESLLSDRANSPVLLQVLLDNLVSGGRQRTNTNPNTYLYVDIIEVFSNIGEHQGTVSSQ